MHIDDEKIIEMLFDRDEQALKIADKKYGPLCRKVAYNIIKNHEEVEGCINNSLFQLWNAIPPARPKSLKAYICGIVRNVAVKICREQARYNENQTNFSELIELFSDGEKIEEQLDSKILGGYINEFLSSIDKTNRKIFVMRYYYNLPTKNIASVLNINDTTVRTKLFRTREELKSFLINKGYKL